MALLPVKVYFCLQGISCCHRCPERIINTVFAARCHYVDLNLDHIDLLVALASNFRNLPVPSRSTECFFFHNGSPRHGLKAINACKFNRRDTWRLSAYKVGCCRFWPNVDCSLDFSEGCTLYLHLHDQ